MALDRGLNKYFTGQPCENGHISERYVQRWACVECPKERSQRSNTPMHSHLWNKLGSARVLSSKKSERSRGVNFTKEEFFQWFQENYEGCCEYCETTIEEYQSRKIYERFGLTGKKFGIDRKNSQVGYTLDNIAVACSICNTVKNFLFDADEFKEIAKKYIRKLYD